MTRTEERCAWAGSDPLMQAYHDTEWGVPLRDARARWEMLASTPMSWRRSPSKTSRR